MVHPDRHLSHENVLAQAIHVQCARPAFVVKSRFVHRLGHDSLGEKSDDLVKAVKEVGNGRRTEIIGTAVVGVVALVVLFVVGFRPRHIGRNAAALTTPQVGHIQVRSAHTRTRSRKLGRSALVASVRPIFVRFRL